MTYGSGTGWTATGTATADFFYLGQRIRDTAVFAQSILIF